MDVIVAGHRLTGRTRMSELGVWHDAVSPAGAPAGLLRFDPRLIDRPGARDRLVAAVRADRRLSAGEPKVLLPIADLVAARGEVWLISARRAMPTLADLLSEPAGAGLGSGGAVTVLVEIAQALLALHAAGLTHGALHAGTVVITEDGSPLLAERGLHEALRGAPASDDIAAWAALARELAAEAAHGDGAGDGTELLLRAAATATAPAGSLSAARDALLAGLAAPPPGTAAASGRDRPAEAVRRWAALPPPSVAPSPVRPPAEPAVTLLGLPGDARPGEPDGGAAGEDEVLRFGPGVARETAAERIWRAGRAPGEGRTGRTRRRAAARRAASWAATALLATLIAIAVLWLRRPPAGDDLAVRTVDVRLPEQTLTCDGTAHFVGVVTTNGGAGTIRYVWLRSDGRKIEQEQRVRSGITTLDFPLHWTVTGTGAFKGTATLRILSPTTTGTPVQDKASFSYKC